MALAVTRKFEATAEEYEQVNGKIPHAPEPEILEVRDLIKA
jgi:hypothetical protein